MSSLETEAEGWWPLMTQSSVCDRHVIILYSHSHLVLIKTWLFPHYGETEAGMVKKNLTQWSKLYILLVNIIITPVPIPNLLLPSRSRTLFKCPPSFTQPHTSFRDGWPLLETSVTVETNLIHSFQFPMIQGDGDSKPSGLRCSTKSLLGASEKGFLPSHTQNTLLFSRVYLNY
jgi:hypothetical protein